MPDAPTQSNPNPGEGGGTPPAAAPGATPPAATPPATSNNGDASFDPTALTPEQLNQVLEKNPHIWKTDRLSELREKSKKFDQAQQKATEAETKALEEQGKFKELSEKQSATISELQTKLQTSTVNQAVTNKLAPLGVVDLEAALALIDRSKIEVAEDGSISGVDEAIEALKTGKAYLFNQGGGTTNPTVGTPSNPGNGSGTSGPAKFKRSQLRDPKFYNENREAILKAQAAGEIEDDVTH
jgi:hypothetical protein